MKKSISLPYTTPCSSLPGWIASAPPNPLPYLAPIPFLSKGLHLPGVQLQYQFSEDVSPPEKAKPSLWPDLHQCPAAF